ncbi:hypothetical protein [Nonomuraea sp. NPDC049709]|uniref:hypothetical protein n=1 Tax=Nonomuraea sp. NPDC049709 TaxID=3154736 RepID=UPI0034227CCF
MKKTISIKGGPPVEIDLDDLALHEAIALEDETGWTMKEMAQELQAQRMKAIAALVYLILKFRLHEDLTYEDLITGRYPISLRKDIVIDDGEPEPAEGGGEEPVPSGDAAEASPSP